MASNNNFYTFSGYMKKEDNPLTASMEDYLEMIYRLSSEEGFTRIHQLSLALHVQSPSATKMVQRLAELKLLKYEKYGMVMLSEEGKQLGATLLRRHEVVRGLLKVIGVDESDLLAETEKIEHTVSPDTADRCEAFVRFVNENPDVVSRYTAFRFTPKG